MIFHFSSCFLFVCLGCALALPNNFKIQSIESNDAVVLSQIISNYIKRYLSHEKMFISLVHDSSNRNLLRFDQELTTNLFHYLNKMDFSYNIGNALVSHRRLWRRAFNIILTVDSISLGNILNGNTVFDFHFFERFIIVVTVENNTINLNEIFKTLWKNNLINANILIQDGPQFWTLYTFMPYQTECSTLTAIKLESFTSLNYTDNMIVPEDQLFPKKLNNFNQCPLTVAASYQDPFVIALDSPSANTTYDGIDVEIVKQISKSLNFVMVYTNLSDGNHGAAYPNNTITGNIKLAVDGDVEFIFGGCGSSKKGAELLSLTNPYLQVSIGFSFIETEPYSPFTRLMAPFKISIWVAICLIIFASMVMILLTKRLSRKWRHFYIGGRINRNPILNMWNSVLGVPIANPRIINGRNLGNFARSLTILWIFLWLIVRNAYQSALYEYLQANRLTSPYDTVEKIRQSDCSIIIPPVTYMIIKDIIDQERIILGSSNFGRNLPTLFDPSEKCIVALSTDLVQKSFNLKHLPYRRLAFTKDRLFMLSVTLNFRKKSMLTHVFNHQLTMLREAGLIDFWVRSRIDDRKLKSKHREPSKLPMENIFAAFQICGFMCFISFIIFILEVISVRCRHIQSIIDYMTY